jgi:hypothetical protein
LERIFLELLLLLLQLLLRCFVIVVVLNFVLKKKKKFSDGTRVGARRLLHESSVLRTLDKCRYGVVVVVLWGCSSFAASLL